MEIEIKVVSTEIIKPSSPTPKSLQKHQLSMIDQLTLPQLIPFIYFYTPNPQIPNSKKSKHLKKSLWETLSIFYPLAGRLVENLYVDCNDSGAPFVEAEANCDLFQVLTREEMNKFLPYKLDGFCMAVQATYFSCGGVTIGLIISHKICDASSFSLFVRTLSAVARNGGGSGIPRPKFDAATYFPPWDIPLFAGLPMEEDIVIKTFTFPASKIALLRERYSSAGLRPTRVEAVSAFIWTRFISACTGKKVDPNKTLILRYPVNVRSRFDPPLSEFHFGNMFMFAAVRPALEDGGVELLPKIRESVEGVEVDDQKRYMETVVEGRKYEQLIFSFTSLRGFPLYEADFGWGKPVRVGFAGFRVTNLAVFMDTKSGGGMEALIHLNKKDMMKFEADFDMSVVKSNL